MVCTKVIHVMTSTQRRLALTLLVAVCSAYGTITRGGDTPTGNAAQATGDQALAVPREALRQELLSRVKKDQEVRGRLIEWMCTQGQVDTQHLKESDLSVIKEMRDIDAANRVWLKKVVEDSGWPTTSLVGKDGANAAWLLLQHADDDPPWQADCLELMKQAPAGEVDAKNVAMLTDRVMVKQTGKQLYGTQVNIVDGRCEVIPLTQPERVDQLRKQVGFPPLAEYLKFVEQMYLKGPAEAPNEPASKLK